MAPPDAIPQRGPLPARRANFIVSCKAIICLANVPVSNLDVGEDEFARVFQYGWEDGGFDKFGVDLRGDFAGQERL